MILGFVLGVIFGMIIYSMYFGKGVT